MKGCEEALKEIPCKVAGLLAEKFRRKILEETADALLLPVSSWTSTQSHR